ncbi:hypothetical protein F8M41_013165 [Gigaspora margarita]|uniref:Uncharacterized protein n=1 Tax=Gigaspora margarita TaxID=4874 RepID=A0A8H4ASS2_GIGMA|nr:hypothetical protein F8M41_013165 [Gigaspora margarita]
MKTNKKKRHRLNPSPENLSMFNLTGQFDMLSVEDKQLVYMIFMKNFLQKNEIKDIFIDKNLIIGKYGSLDFIIECLLLDNHAHVFPVDIKNFMKNMDERPRGTRGFLVSNSLLSDEAIEIFNRHDRIFISSETDISNLIKEVENHVKNIFI